MRIFLFFLLIYPLGLCAQLDTVDFNDGWRWASHAESKYTSPTKIPVVYAELVRRWFKTEDDWYKNLGSDGGAIYDAPYFVKKFAMDPSDLKKNVTLVFEGLDTYADVELNGELILQADNAFRTWRINISDYLKEDNELSVRFYSPLKNGKEILDTLSYKLPAGNDAWKYKVSPVVRKPAYHFGWDWGPRLLSMNTGITKPVYLLIGEEDDSIKEVRHKRKVELVREYEFRMETRKIYFDDEELQHREDHKPLLPLKKDTIGRSFYFKINGVPTFMRGANYIPMSMVPSVLKDEDYRKLLIDVKESNINMLRVWGGGIYENDIFYELCDSLGIWVWQDFMFANMLPVSEHMTENIRMEVRDQVRRLSKFPCIIHWNGNNELDVAWKNWGWQKQMGYSTEDSTSLYENYHYIFKELIPEELHKILPEASYTHTSPLSNWGMPKNFNYGSMHYWGVFHGTDSFEDYRKNVGRFNSEYGFQSLPNWSEVKTWSDFEGMLRERQKSYKGMKPLEDAMKQYYRMPRNPKEYVYLSQLTQAYAMGMAIQAHRLAGTKRCGGTLYWQLNDVWPGISWSGIDNRGEWKALQYKVRELYHPAAYFVDSLKQIEFCGDNKVYRPLNLPWSLENIKSGQMKSDGEKFLFRGIAGCRGSVLYPTQKLPKLEEYDVGQTYCRLGPDENGYEHIHYFVKPNQLKLQKSDLKLELVKIDEGIKVICQAKTLIKDLWLYTDVKGKWLDNYVDVLPNEEREIIFQTKVSLEEFRASFEQLCLNDVLID